MVPCETLRPIGGSVQIQGEPPWLLGPPYLQIELAHKSSRVSLLGERVRLHAHKMSLSGHKLSIQDLNGSKRNFHGSR
jgi:hypothetical protein